MKEKEVGKSSWKWSWLMLPPEIEIDIMQLARYLFN